MAIPEAGMEFHLCQIRLVETFPPPKKKGGGGPIIKRAMASGAICSHLKPNQ